MIISIVIMMSHASSDTIHLSHPLLFWCVCCEMHSGLTSDHESEQFLTFAYIKLWKYPLEGLR